MRAGRTALWCGAGLAALLVIAVLAVALAVHRPRLAKPLVQWALAPGGGDASIAELKLSLGPPTLSISGLEIKGPPDDGELLQIDHLQAELIPGRFLRGGPWLRHVEARGLVFQRLRPRESEGPPDLTPLTRLFDIEDLSLTVSRLRLALPGGDLTAEGLLASLVPGEGGIRSFNCSGELTFSRNGFAIAKGKVAAQGKVTPDPAIEVSLELTQARLGLAWIESDVAGHASLKVTRKNLQADVLRMALPRPRLILNPREQRNIEPILLEASGSATLNGEKPSLEIKKFDLGGLLSARGRLGGVTLDAMTGTMEGDIPGVERLIALLAPMLPGKLTGINVAGDLPFRLTLAADRKEPVQTLELNPRQLLVSWPDPGIGCRFGGTVIISSTMQGWLKGKAGIGWKLSSEPGDASYRGRPLPLGKLEVQGSAEADGGNFRVKGVDITSGTLGRLTGELAFRGGNPTGSMSASRLPTAALIPIAAVFSGREPKGWSATGAINLSARIDPVQPGHRVAAAVALEQIGFSSPAGDAMGVNLSGRLDLEALLGSRPLLKADLVMNGGEALWGTIYVNLSRNPLDLHAGGTREGPDEYKDLVLNGGLAGFGRLGLEGEARRAVEGWRHQGRLELGETMLGPVFRTFLRDPFVGELPGLAGLQMDGTGRANISFSGTDKAVDLRGRFLLRSGSVRREGEPPLLSGLDIDLPVSYSLGVPDPASPRPARPAEWGRLSVSMLRLAGEELGNLDMPVALVPNRLYFGGEIDTSLLGARLRLQRIEVDEPHSPNFRINLAARLDGLDLARITGKAPLLEGRLGGALDHVRIDRERLTAKGGLTGELFGGLLDIRRVSAERPFSEGREVGADVNVANLDLEKLSAALDVGRITGGLSGSIDGLRIAYGQPVAFHLRMESVPVKGVQQTVSLKAVNSISVVSTGSSLSGPGVSFMTSFFKEFAYSKIGFECGLKNDVFTVRGLIKEGGVEYLVKRSLLSGINVINRNPDNRIGFSDMIERAKRATGEKTE